MNTNHPDLTSVTPTICALLGIDPPQLADSAPLAPVMDAASESLRGGNIERLLIYAPDALGRHLYKRYAGEFAAVRQHAPIAVELSSMTPSFTPVCFASMLSGLPPETHGIQAYEKPVLECDTLFDALERAGKSCALVALDGSSMATIFGNRGVRFTGGPPHHKGPGELGSPVVQYIGQYDPQALWRGLRLLRDDEFDVVIVYQMQYDDLLHATGPFSPESLLAFRLHLASFDRLARAARTRWQGRAHALCVVPDHGGHWDEAKQMGMHGTSRPEDMELTHFWGLYGADGPRPAWLG
jgi:predicted AlkP superfamily pyrophosphatase or phosphodiesterase